MDSAKYNLRNPAVKRIMQEMREIQRETSGEIMAEALEDNIFEWHFAIRGPPDTEFEGGIYHGRIILPPEYPFKPPSFIMISASGRFETGVKICLSMSSHHPEHWQPSWSVRVALVALIAFLPTSGQGAIGSLDFSKEEKRILAIESRKAPPKYGSEAKQQIINGLHARMLAGGQGKESSSENESVAPPCQPTAAPAKDAADGQTRSNQGSAAASMSTMEGSQTLAPEQTPTVGIHSEVQPADGLRHRTSVLSNQQPAVQETGSSSHASGDGQRQPLSSILFRRSAQDWEDLGLTVLAVLLSVLIAAIVLRKIFVATGSGSDVNMDADMSSFD
ncbi:hypothetical protein ABBQ38_007491 [Trebouxia sp. C0009 RCD-2024]